MDLAVSLDRRLRNIVTGLHTQVDCSICLDVLTVPVSTRCNHQFCRDCILKVIGSNASALCPLCMQPITKRSFTVNITLPEIIESVKSLCSAVERDKHLCDLRSITAFDFNRQHEASSSTRIEELVSAGNFDSDVKMIAGTPMNVNAVTENVKSVVNIQSQQIVHYQANCTDNQSSPVVHTLLTQISREFHVSNNVDLIEHQDVVELSSGTLGGSKFLCNTSRAKNDCSLKPPNNETKILKNVTVSASNVKKGVIDEILQDFDALSCGEMEAKTGLTAQRPNVSDRLNEARSEDTFLDNENTSASVKVSNWLSNHCISPGKCEPDLSMSSEMTADHTVTLNGGKLANAFSAKKIFKSRNMEVLVSNGTNESSLSGDDGCEDPYLFISSQKAPPKRRRAEQVRKKRMTCKSNRRQPFFCMPSTLKMSVKNNKVPGSMKNCDETKKLLRQSKALPKLSSAADNEVAVESDTDVLPLTFPANVDVFDNFERLVGESVSCTAKPMASESHCRDVSHTLICNSGDVDGDDLDWNIFATPARAPSPKRAEKENIFNKNTSVQGKKRKLRKCQKTFNKKVRNCIELDEVSAAIEDAEKHELSIEDTTKVPQRNQLKDQSTAESLKCIRASTRSSNLNTKKSYAADDAPNEGFVRPKNFSEERKRLQLPIHSTAREFPARLIHTSRNSGDAPTDALHANEMHSQVKGNCITEAGVTAVVMNENLEKPVKSCVEIQANGVLQHKNDENITVKCNVMSLVKNATSENSYENCVEVQAVEEVHEIPKCDVLSCEDDEYEANDVVVHFGIQQGQVFGNKDVLVSNQNNMSVTEENDRQFAVLEPSDLDKNNSSTNDQLLPSSPCHTSYEKPNRAVASLPTVNNSSLMLKMPQRKTFCLDIETQELMALAQTTRGSDEYRADPCIYVGAGKPTIPNSSNLPKEYETNSKSSINMQGPGASEKLNSVPERSSETSAESHKAKKNTDFLTTILDCGSVRYLKLGRVYKPLFALMRQSVKCQTDLLEISTADKVNSSKCWNTVGCQTEWANNVNNDMEINFCETEMKNCTENASLAYTNFIIPASQETPAVDSILNGIALATHHSVPLVEARGPTNSNDIKDDAHDSDTDTNSTVSYKIDLITPKPVVDASKTFHGSQSNVLTSQWNASLSGVKKSLEYPVSSTKPNDDYKLDEVTPYLNVPVDVNTAIKKNPERPLITTKPSDDYQVDKVTPNVNSPVTINTANVLVLNATADCSQVQEYSMMHLRSDTEAEAEDVYISDTSATEDVLPPTPQKYDLLLKKDQRQYFREILSPKPVQQNLAKAEKQPSSSKYMLSRKKFKRIITPANSLSQSSQETQTASFTSFKRRYQDASVNTEEINLEGDDEFLPTPNDCHVDTCVGSGFKHDPSLRFVNKESVLPEQCRDPQGDAEMSKVYQNIHQDLKIAKLCSGNCNRDDVVEEKNDEHTTDAASQNCQDLPFSSDVHPDDLMVEMNAIRNSQSSVCSSQELPMDTQKVELLKNEISEMEIQMMRLKDKAAEMKQAPANSTILPEHTHSAEEKPSSKPVSKEKSTSFDGKDKLDPVSADRIGGSVEKRQSKSTDDLILGDIIWDEEDFEDILFTPSPLRQQKVDHLHTLNNPFDQNRPNSQKPNNPHDNNMQTYERTSQKQQRSSPTKIPQSLISQEQHKSKVVRQLSLSSGASSTDKYFAAHDDTDFSAEVIAPSSESKRTGYTSQKKSLKKTPYYSMVVSGATISEQNNVQKLCDMLNGIFSKTFASDTTHVVIKTVGHYLCDRTLKYFLGIASGCWIVSYQWVVDSLNAKKALSEENYEVKGDNCDGIHHGPRRARLSVSPLLKNYELCCIGPYTEITVVQLCDLVKRCGGTGVKDPESMSRNPRTTKFIIVEKLNMSSHDLGRLYTLYQVPIVILDWLIDSLSAFAIKPIAKYALFPRSK